MGETLFDKDLDFEAYTNDYFAAAFGADGAAVRDYLETLCQYFCPANLRGSAKNSVEDTGINSSENKGPIHGNAWAAEQFAKIPDVLENFAPVIARNMAHPDAARRRSWEYMYYHAEICRYLARIYGLAAKNEMDAAREVLSAMQIYLADVEMHIHEGFDLFLFDRFVRGVLRVKSVK